MGDQIDIFGQLQEDPARNMKDFFIVSPFSVIDTTSGEWQRRKKRWDKLIGDTGESRDEVLDISVNKKDYNYARNKAKLEAKLQRKVSKEEYYKDFFKPKMKSVSLLDSCLAEVLCKWFAKEGFWALDPFAGDSVFGYVSCYTGLKFTGIELRKEQALLNQQRLDKDNLKGCYINDTSANMDNHILDNSMDFIFSCPPYLWLEEYSDMEEDLSTMDEEAFFETYGSIISNTYKKLKENRFAVLVISEVRDKNTGRYVGFVPKTIKIMEDAGYIYYNEIILLNSVGSLPMRSGKSMNASRKVGRRHQNVLVFYKGDPKKIKTEFPEIIPKNTYYDNKQG